MRNLRYLVVAALAFVISACSNAPKISDGAVVKVDYVLTLADGSEFESTEGKDPLSFIVGAGQVLPSFEDQIKSMATGQTKTFTLKADNAYGPIDDSKIQTLPKDDKFKDVDLQEGTVIFANSKLPNGQVRQVPLKVIKISDTEVTLDANHPLAGKDITFKVTVVEVQDSEADTKNVAENKEGELKVETRPDSAKS